MFGRGGVTGDHFSKVSCTSIYNNLPWVQLVKKGDDGIYIRK
jgi:hypothetical protein